jgi:DNA repair protein RecO (recombination protein O)
MDSSTTEALLVRGVDYRESDRIVTLITRDLGKVGVVAYGAKRSRRRFPPGALQPFQLLRVVVTLRRGRDLYELVEAEVVEAYRTVPGDSGRYSCAVYALELAREITPEGEPDARPLVALVRFLRRIDHDGASPGAMAAVLLALLTQGGFAPALDRCATCGREAPRGKAGHFEVSRGVVCSSCGGSGPLLRGHVREGLIQAAAWEQPTACSEAELATAVHLLCGFAHQHLGKELRSWGLLDRYLHDEGDALVSEPPDRDSP